MMPQLITVLFFCLLTGFASKSDYDTADDVQRIQGTWDWDSDKPQPDPERDLIERIVIKDNTLTFHLRYKFHTETWPTVFSLDPWATPKQINFSPIDGINKGKIYRGVYEIQNGQLKFCYRGPGSTRPKNFDDKAQGNRTTAFIYLVDNTVKQ